MIETIRPRDEKHWLELRKQDVTSTETAALFGISPYMTAFELWHRKHDNLDVEFQMNDRVVWGQRLQDSIAAGIFADQGWIGHKKTEYMRDPDLRMGASFDFEFMHIDGEGQLLEIKNVDSLVFKEGWIVEGEDVQAPPHLELQVQQQLALTGYKAAWLGALIGGNRVVLIRRIPDPVVIESIKSRIKAFWTSIQNDTEPKPDFGRDSDFIARLYSFAEPGKVFNADDRVNKLAFAYKRAAEEAKAAEEKKDAARAEILTLIADAEKVVGETFSINAGLIGPKWIERYERKGYRSFKINWKKEKA
jgi:putative phage-type endonuclease